MITRDDVLHNKVDIGTADTLVYNLNYTEPISELDIRIDGTNGATSNKENPPELNISKIEIVDGSDVLWSLYGPIALSTFAQVNGAMPHGYRTEVANDSPYQTIPIRFGRFLYDTQLAFMPTAFRNPQLKITFDEATVHAAGATGYVSDSLTLSLMAKIMSEVESPRGYLSSLEKYHYTSLASGDTVVDMPTDYAYRMLMIRVYESEVDLRSGVSTYELNCDGGRFKPFDYSADFALDKMAEVFKAIPVQNVALVTDAARTETWVGLDYGGVCQSAQNDMACAVDTFWPASATVYAFNHAGANQTNAPAHLTVNGWAIHNTILFPFGQLDNPDTWFNPSLYNNIRLYLTNANADADVRICVQQLRTY